jgi:hypothetical protein
VFFHIAKTGGSSFNKSLDEIQQKMGWKMPNWHFYWFRRHSTPPSDVAMGAFMARDQVIHRRHLTPIFLDFTSTQKCLTFTMHAAREPIDRVISAF